MGKKILVVLGSPRKGGNSEALAEALIAAAEAKGHSVTRFSLAERKVKPCLGCGECLKNNGPCIQRDDMHDFYGPFEEADMVVLVSPLYYWHVSSELKSVIDRTYACYHRFPKVECALLMAAGDTNPSVYRSAVCWYEQMTGELGWTDRGRVLALGANGKGTVSAEDLRRAAELGASL